MTRRMQRFDFGASSFSSLRGVLGLSQSPRRSSAGGALNHLEDCGFLTKVHLVGCGSLLKVTPERQVATMTCQLDVWSDGFTGSVVSESRRATGRTGSPRRTASRRSRQDIRRAGPDEPTLLMVPSERSATTPAEPFDQLVTSSIFQISPPRVTT